MKKGLIFQCIDCPRTIHVSQEAIDDAHQNRMEFDNDSSNDPEDAPDGVAISCGDTSGIELIKEIMETGSLRLSSLEKEPDDGCGAKYDLHVIQGKCVLRPTRTRLSVACWFCDCGQIEPSPSEIEDALEGNTVLVACSDCDYGRHELELGDDGIVELSPEPVYDDDSE